MKQQHDKATILEIGYRFDGLDRLIEEDKVVRGTWGMGCTACLIGGLSQEAKAEARAERCPPFLMPVWMARLSTRMNDLGAQEAHSGLIRRYARVMRQAALRLSPADWESVHRRLVLWLARLVCPAAGSIGLSVLALWERLEAGDPPEEEEWKAVLAEAEQKARQLGKSPEQAWGSIGVRRMESVWGLAQAADRKALTAQEQEGTWVLEEAYDVIPPNSEDAYADVILHYIEQKLREVSSDCG